MMIVGKSKKNKIINNKGMSMVELLILISVGSVAIAGLVKSSQQNFTTSQLLKTHEDTEDFKTLVYSFLNQNCEGIFKSSNLSPPILGVKKVNTLGLGTRPDYFDMRQGGRKQFREKIKIIDMRFKDDQTFYLYYKYNTTFFEKRGEGACTKIDPRGCYYLSCEIDYKCPNPPCEVKTDFTSCDPIDCGIPNIANSLSNITCEPNEILVGLTGIKEHDCLGCPDGEFLIGIERKNDGSIEPECLEVDTCGNKDVAIVKKEGDTYTMDCAGVVCERGEHFTLNSAGNIECEKVCHGGQVFKDGKCDCPEEHMVEDHNGNCTCKEGTEINAQGECSCPPGKEIAHGSCLCKSRYGTSEKCFCIPGHKPTEHHCECWAGSKNHLGECIERPPNQLHQGV